MVHSKLMDLIKRMSTDELIDYLKDQYNEKHRNDFLTIVRLAQKVETLSKTSSESPIGLTLTLQKIEKELLEHLKSEENILIELLHTDNVDRTKSVVHKILEEHSFCTTLMKRIEQITNSLTPPHGASSEWSELYNKLNEFQVRLKEQIDIENNVLFPKFLRHN